MASATSWGGREACGLGAPALAAGAVIEPLAHPKPGAVTRLRPQADKDVLTFAVHSVALASALLASCEASASGSPDPIAVGLRAYRASLRRLGLRVNVGLGQALMLIPLSASLPTSYGSPELMAGRASELIMYSSAEASREYYALLRDLEPSHLGFYRGPLPDFREEPRLGLGELLRLVTWDLVASEVTGGYRLTLRALKVIEGAGGVSEGAIARALAWALAEAGDTLIARKWGLRAYLASRAEVALEASRGDPVRALEALDDLWRGRGWSPGAVLDVISAALGLHLASRALGQA
ncbi:MAG: triphosphoribosyl-dephospho-CoA synthase [Acidilobus sp.]|nr:triphosphoribosyl-dephospho-CoA synthase [Acidilobus sp.]